ncbi:MAG: hypothetical protein LBV16_01685 [Elusimicrobiota bacterium]|jgi:hypothetical protein|nr:hypothetical protein [Elusimicrobiota bacterium]
MQKLKYVKGAIVNCYQAFIYILLSVSLAIVFTMQVFGMVGSDVLYHIKMAEQMPYSLLLIVYRFVDPLFVKHIGVAIILTLVSIGTIYSAKFLIKRLYNINPHSAFIISLSGFFMMPVQIPGVKSNFYLGLIAPLALHNGTYILMKFLAPLTLMWFFKIFENYLVKISFKDWLTFTVLLFMTNFAKPSFFMSFAAVSLLFFTKDFFAIVVKNGKKLFYDKQSKKKIINILIFGLAVLISASILICQQNILFGDSKNIVSIGYSVFYKMANPNHYNLMLIQSFLFIFLVFIYNIRNVKNDKKYIFVLLSWIISTLIALFLFENGPRRNHGNLAWGAMVWTYLIFIFSMVKLHFNTAEFVGQSAGGGGIVGRVKGIFLIIIYFVLCMHLLSGLRYFMLLLNGGDWDY